MEWIALIGLVKKKSVEEDDNVTATMVMNVLLVLMMERKHFN
jgi:hypothetical protein